MPSVIQVTTAAREAHAKWSVQLTAMVKELRDHYGGGRLGDSTDGNMVDAFADVLWKMKHISS